MYIILFEGNWLAIRWNVNVNYTRPFDISSTRQLTNVFVKSTLYTKQRSSAFSPSWTTTLILTSLAKQGVGLSTLCPSLQSCWFESTNELVVLFLPMWKKSKLKLLCVICVRMSRIRTSINSSELFISSATFCVVWISAAISHWKAVSNAIYIIVSLNSSSL